MACGACPWYWKEFSGFYRIKSRKYLEISNHTRIPAGFKNEITLTDIVTIEARICNKSNPSSWTWRNITWSLDTMKYPWLVCYFAETHACYQFKDGPPHWCYSGRFHKHTFQTERFHVVSLAATTEYLFKGILSCFLDEDVINASWRICFSSTLHS